LYQDWAKTETSPWLEKVLQNFPLPSKLSLRSDTIATVPFGSGLNGTVVVVNPDWQTLKQRYRRNDCIFCIWALSGRVPHVQRKFLAMEMT
jgi:hypothetical protein